MAPPFRGALQQGPVFCYQSAGETCAFEWTGVEPREIARWPRRGSEILVDRSRDRVVQYDCFRATELRGFFGGAERSSRTIEFPRLEAGKGSAWGPVSSAILIGDALVVWDSQQAAMSLHLGAPGGRWVRLTKPGENPSSCPGAMAQDGESVLVLGCSDNLLSWRQLDVIKAGSAIALSQRRLVVSEGFWFSPHPRIRFVADKIVVLSRSLGHHTDVSRITVFERASLRLLFRVDCPVFYGRGGPAPDPYFCSLEANGRQLLLREQKRGWGLLDGRALDDLADSAGGTSIEPARLLERAVWQPFAAEEAFLVDAEAVVLREKGPSGDRLLSERLAVKG